MAWKMHGDGENMEHKYSEFPHDSKKQAEHKIVNKLTQIILRSYNVLDQ